MTRIFSFGGGIQSVAVMVLSAQGKLPYTHFVFANVGDDSENPDTIRYNTLYTQPFIRQNSLEFVEIRRTTKGNPYPSLHEEMINHETSIPIPVLLEGTGMASRNCTEKWKVVTIERWVRANFGATKEKRLPIGVGISIDEIHRMRTDDPEREPFTYKEYPLIDLRLSRNDCAGIITAAGLPIPPKSSCWFCPYKRKSEWMTMRSEKPELFDKAVALEAHLIAKRKARGKSPVFLSQYDDRLDKVIPLASMSMFEDDDDPMACESGHCMT